MKVIGFGIPSKYLAFPFIMPVFWFLRNFIGSYIQEYGDSNSQQKMIHHPIFISFITIFGDIIAGSLNIFTYFRLKSKVTERSSSIYGKVETVQQFERITEGFSNKPWISSEKGALMLICCVSVLEVTMISGFFILGFYSNTYFSFTMNITLIVFEAIIAAPILKYKIYLHQIVSIIIILIGFMLVCTPQIQTGISSENPKDSLKFIPIYFGFYMIFALLDVIQKWIMQNRFYTPYKLVLLQGTISCCFFVVIFLILPFCPCKWDFCNYNPGIEIMIEPFISTFQLLFSSDVGNRAVMSIVYELISGVYIMLLFLTIYYFTPTQRSVSDSLASFINWIILVATHKIPFSVFPLIGFVIALFSCFIYNEIIILYCFGMEYYTKMEIDQRSIKDKADTINFELDNFQDNKSFYEHYE